jgi:1-acyl-sn-glycerol-3-phosphate acyltransferase
MERVYKPVIGVARVVFAMEGLKFRLEGESNVPRSGGAVMVINHTGYMDFTYAGLAARRSGRYVRFMAKESVFSHPVTGPLMRGMKHIPVDRQAGMASFRAAVKALKDGEIVGVFAEGTISRSFEIKEFKSGAVRMAQLAGVPILPTTVWGSQRVWTKDHRRRLGRSKIPIFVTVGEPMPVARGENADAATVLLRERMIAQLHRQQEEYPPLLGDDLVFLPARLGGKAPTPEEALASEIRDSSRTKDEFNR